MINWILWSSGLVLGSFWIHERFIYARRVFIKPNRSPWFERLAGIFPLVCALIVIKTILVDIRVVQNNSMYPSVKPGTFIAFERLYFNINRLQDSLKIPEVLQLNPQHFHNYDLIVVKHPKEDQVLIKRLMLQPKDNWIVSEGIIWIHEEALISKEFTSKANVFTKDCKYWTIKGNRSLYCQVFKVYSEKEAQKKHEIFENQTENLKSGSNCSYIEKVLHCSVKSDQYFLIGDNFKLSEDSRSLGFIPSSLLLGKVIHVF